MVINIKSDKELYSHKLFFQSFTIHYINSIILFSVGQSSPKWAWWGYLQWSLRDFLSHAAAYTGTERNGNCRCLSVVPFIFSPFFKSIYLKSTGETIHIQSNVDVGLHGNCTEFQRPKATLATATIGKYLFQTCLRIRQPGGF